MNQFETLHLILNEIPFVGHGAFTFDELKEDLAYKGCNESRRNIRLGLAYLCDTKQILVVGEIEKDRLYAQPNDTDENKTNEKVTQCKPSIPKVLPSFPQVAHHHFDSGVVSVIDFYYDKAANDSDFYTDGIEPISGDGNIMHKIAIINQINGKKC
jgi:hypothetical protein